MSYDCNYFLQEFTFFFKKYILDGDVLVNNTCGNFYLKCATKLDIHMLCQTLNIW